MRILSIETSCDDTAIALVEFTEKGGQTFCTVLHNAVSSQSQLHNEYGGVFPALAKREHIKNLPLLYTKLVEECGENFDSIAVTVGPGLEPCLWAGITFAKELSTKLGIPTIGVNHMEGHLLSSLLPEFALNKPIPLRQLPDSAVSLLVSGGHTEIVKVKNIGEYEIVGSTLDDAVGEAFDKVARMIDLPYPGGPEISRLAEMARQGERENILSGSSALHFPRPMINSKDSNFSFSGLKTAVLYYIRDNPIKNDNDKIAIARAFEDAAIAVLCKKITNVMNESGSTYLLLGGGVSANKFLRAELAKLSSEFGFTIYEPQKELYGDNALMIALSGYLNKKSSHELAANGNLKL